MTEFSNEAREILAGAIVIVAAQHEENKEIIEIRDSHYRFIANVCVWNYRSKFNQNLINVSFYNGEIDEIEELDEFPRSCTAWFINERVNVILDKLAKFAEERDK